MEKGVAAAGEDLVRVALMPDVPDEGVVWGVEDVMQGDGQFHHPQVGAQVALFDRNDIDDIVAQLFGQSGQYVHRKGAQVGGGVHRKEQRVFFTERFFHGVRGCREEGAARGLCKDSESRGQSREGKRSFSSRGLPRRILSYEKMVKAECKAEVERSFSSRGLPKGVLSYPDSEEGVSVGDGACCMGGQGFVR